MRAASAARVQKNYALGFLSPPFLHSTNVQMADKKVLIGVGAGVALVYVFRKSIAAALPYGNFLKGLRGVQAW